MLKTIKGLPWKLTQLFLSMRVESVCILQDITMPTNNDIIIPNKYGAIIFFFNI